MVVGINVYKFEINQNSSGDIEPEFRTLVSQMSSDYNDLTDRDLISIDDKYAIFFNHTTGSSFKQMESETKKFYNGRLKETQYGVLSHYHKEIDKSQYLTICFFNLDEEVELFETIFHQMAEKLEKIYGRMMTGNLKDYQFLNSIEQDIKSETSFAIFQIERLSNLSKLQKLGLIFASPERMKTLDLLLQGPTSRKYLRQELEKIKINPNIDLILQPFLELNLIRRDWARGVHNKKTGVIEGEGEHLFLLKDIGLIRKPPTDILRQMEKNKSIGAKYLKSIQEYYAAYDPFTDIYSEGKILSRFILDPDIYDFITLMGTRFYPVEKIPKITSEFTDFQVILKDLLENKILIEIQDDTGKKWICLFSEISPLVLFPDYMVANLSKHVSNKLSKSESNTMSVKKPRNVDQFQELTTEIAQMALKILENTHGETVEF